jgi:predicted phosphodiesterase
MPRERFWTDENLKLLFTVSKDNYKEHFPDHKWSSLAAKRKLYRRKIREGEMKDIESGDLGTHDKIMQMERQLKEALRQRDTARGKNLDYIAALEAAIKELWLEFEIEPPKPWVSPVSPKGQKQVAVLCAGDWQLGKITPTYDSKVCEERVKIMANKANEMGALHSKISPVEEIKLYLLGDMVEGESIFPTQHYLIDGGLYRQVAIDGPRILSNLILELLKFYKKVNVVAVIGNHGNVKMRFGPAHPETNMDRMLYRIVADRFVNEKRVTFDIPDGNDGERHWHFVDYIYDFGFLLMHGDQIRGGVTGFWPSAQRKALGWIDAIDKPYDYLIFGHHHTPTRLTLGRRLAICNGSTESSNTYAQENLAAIGTPQQYMCFVTPKYGITSEYWLQLSEKVPRKKIMQEQNYV